MHRLRLQEGKKSSDIYAECINTCACDPEKIKAQYDQKVEELENQNGSYEQQIQDQQYALEEAERLAQEALDRAQEEEDDDSLVDEVVDAVDDAVDAVVDKVEKAAKSVWGWLG